MFTAKWSKIEYTEMCLLKDFPHFSLPQPFKTIFQCHIRNPEQVHTPFLGPAPPLRTTALKNVLHETIAKTVNKSQLYNLD